MINFQISSLYLAVFTFQSLRSKDAMATKTSLKKCILVPSVLIAIIPTHLLCRTLLKLRDNIQVQEVKYNFVVACLRPL